MNSIDLDILELDTSYETDDFIIEHTNSTDIAVIGMSGRFASASNLSEYWDMLSSGIDAISEIPSERASDLEAYLNNKNIHSYNYLKAGYLSEISEFDYSFFNISPKEAALTDPNQRLFLQEAWSAIEDAGYGGESIIGTKTGVFVGYSSDFGDSYKNMICVNDPDLLELSVAGNVKSIIAARISYMLNLKGPAMMIDTACSSSLVAIHQACRSLRNGESDMCIVGSLKLITVPIRSRDKTVGVQDVSGVESSDGKTRTFDDSSNGTGIGEGVGALILKPLAKALQDNDNVIAVIKGSAVNQDGLSVGITAPNAAAQEEVISQAWQDANINPETISYIEAHGTGTALGDPIEILGITRAFEKYTSKRQFCAIGSVKSNIGHLDQAAGMASIIKTILSLKNECIPPIVHFQQPNRKIDFHNSSVYVNNKLAPWPQTNKPRRAGISAFGLSGTNCHVVVEEAPKQSTDSQELPFYLLPLSARNEESLKQLVDKYISYLNAHKNECLTNIVYTASVGRSHHSHRLVLLFKTRDELEALLKEVKTKGLDIKTDDIYYGSHLLYEITISEQNALSEDVSNLFSEKYTEDAGHKIATLYIKGAQIKWDILYSNIGSKRIPLPTYPFNTKKCWVSHNYKQRFTSRKEISHPLIDRCVLNTGSTIIFSSMLSSDYNWELADHNIKGKYILPGTSYIEIIINQMNYLFEGTDKIYSISDLHFIQPFVIEDDETKELQTLITKEGNTYKFQFLTYNTLMKQWLTCADGKIEEVSKTEPLHIDIEGLSKKMQLRKNFSDNEMEEREIQTGPRWNCNQTIYYGENKSEFLASLELDERFSLDFDHYTFHPSLADCAMNAINFTLEESLFLPFSYKEITIYKPLVRELYSYFRVCNVGNEVCTMCVSIINKNGEVLAEINNYSIKKVETVDSYVMNDLHHSLQLNWIEASQPQVISDHSEQNALIFCRSKDVGNFIKEYYKNFIIVLVGDSFEKINSSEYSISNNEEDYIRLLSELPNIPENIVYALGLEELNSVDNTASGYTAIIGLFFLTKAMLKCKIQPSGNLHILSLNAFSVKKGEAEVNPYNAAMLAMAEVIRSEYPNYTVKLLDTDSESLKRNPNLLLITDFEYLTTLRKGIYYTRQLQQGKELITTNENRIRENGVYLITGGIGGLGLEVARHIASQNKVSLLLLSRTTLPESSQWDSIIASNTNNKLTSKIQIVKEIEGSGSKVYSYPCDISEYEDVKTLLSKVHEQFSKIDGVIHCAGVGGDGFLFTKDLSQFYNTVKAKIDGTIWLSELTKDPQPDFFVLFSSITSFMAVPGQSDYAAANAFLDAYARLLRNRGINAIAINWPAWKDTGMAVDYNIDFTKSPFMPIKTAKALTAMWNIISLAESTTIPVVFNHEYLNQTEYKFPFELSENLKIHPTSTSQKKHTNIALKSSKVLLKNFDGEPSELMLKIAEAWVKTLGIQEVDIHESFYNLGGNSILAMEMLKAYAILIPGAVDVADIFTYTTVHDMYNYLSPKLEGDKKIEDVKVKISMNEILEKLAIGEISITEAEKLM